MLREWASTRQEIIEFVSQLPDEKFALTGIHAAFGSLTVQGVLKLMLDHDQEHIDDLKKVVNKYGLQSHGNR